MEGFRLRSLLLVLLLIVAVIPAVNAAPSSVEVTIKLASTSAQTEPFRTGRVRAGRLDDLVGLSGEEGHIQVSRGDEILVVRVH